MSLREGGDQTNRNRRDVDVEVCGLPYDLSEGDKKAVLEVHNRVRRQEGSSNMKQLVNTLL